jgi:hypothetical protein
LESVSLTYDNTIQEDAMKRIAIVAASLLVPLFCSAAAFPQAPDGNAKTDMAKIEVTCRTAPSAAACRVNVLLGLVQARVKDDFATVHQEALQSEYATQPSMQVSTIPAITADFHAYCLSLLDEAQAQTVGASAKLALEQYRDAVSSSIADLSRRNGEIYDAYSTRLDAYAAASSRMADALRAALGMKPRPDGVFGKSHWGDSRETVLAVESKPYDSTTDRLVYATRFDGRQAYAIYDFVDGKLVDGIYVIQALHADDNAYLDDYDQLSRSLRDSYGWTKPVSFYWTDSRYMHDQSKWGLAVATGQLSQVEFWSTEQSEITHTLKGRGQKIFHVVRYASIEYAPLQNAQLAQNAETIP